MNNTKNFVRPFSKSSQKTLLSIDGGGVRGVIALQFLREIENIARARSGLSDLRLCECFDYIGGTSTGAIIAACIAKGMSVDEIQIFYENNARLMFYKNRLPNLRSLYSSSNLENELKKVFGANTRLGDIKRTLLMLVMLNVSTISPWPVSSNPRAKYNKLTDRSSDSNLNIKLWKLIRASTAAPFYFEPQGINTGRDINYFFDGGLTPYNNPAFKLFQMATLPEYKLEWPTGDNNMLLISVGTGILKKPLDIHTKSPLLLLKSLPTTVHSLMFTASAEQDLLCRSFGTVLAGDLIDGEVGDRVNGLPIGDKSLFSYARYNVDLNNYFQSFESSWFNRPTFELDDCDSIDLFIKAGQYAAKKFVSTHHFDRFW